MADDLRMALMELVRKAGAAPEVGTDWLREGVQLLAQRVMELEVEQHLGAGRYERVEERLGQRNGYRERRWDTRVGSIELQVPRVRDGSYYPALPEPRRRSEQALVAVIQEAYVHGVSTRRVDDVVQALGITGVSKSEVSRLCEELDVLVTQFRTRPLEESYPYLWLDATYLKVRQDGHVRSMAAVAAIGVSASGVREVLGMEVGPSEEGAFWLQFLRGLVERGLHGVQLVASDAHQGLKGAIATALRGSAWQRCRVHFLRNVLSVAPKGMQAVVAATVRTVFAQPHPASAHTQWRQVADHFRGTYPRVASLMDDAEDDVLAYLGFPEEHWQQLWSTNPLERLNKEIKRRTTVVGIFPNTAAAQRLVGALLLEQHEEWQVNRRYFSSESLAKLQGQATALQPAAALLTVS